MVKGILKETLQNGLRNLLSDAETRVTREVAWRAARFKRKLVKDVASLFIILMSILFLAVAFTYLFIEYLSLSITLSFLTTGIVLLIIGLIVKAMR